ncbi:MAG TPA: DUF2141 domain-containing protein [Burkholderiaceae bacterium]|nr:DUF2141 domain-containing protein [Burkholderiaceae bacterium]
MTPSSSQALSRAAALMSTALALSASPARAAAGTLELQVDNVGSAEGSLMIALYDKAGDWRDRPVRSLQQVARPGSVTVTFADLPPGSYAIALYHDRNGNGKLDSNVMGIPREPYGFSGKAPTMGPANWEQARFEVPAAGARVVVKLSD